MFYGKKTLVFWVVLFLCCAVLGTASVAGARDKDTLIVANNADLKTLDPRNQTVVALTLDGGLSWSNYAMTDQIEPLDAYIARAIGIDYAPGDVHYVAPEHPAYGKVLYEKLGADVEYYVDGFCALPPTQDEFGNPVYQALLVSRGKVFRLGAGAATQIGTTTTSKRMFPFCVVAGAAKHARPSSTVCRMMVVETVRLCRIESIDKRAT